MTAPAPVTIYGLPLPNQIQITHPANEHEHEHITKYYIGVDEVARGCLAGPVVSCAMCLDINKIMSTLDAGTYIPKICDSKKLTPKNRILAEHWILNHTLSHAIGQASVNEIDSLNIREATFLAMNRALLDCITKLQQIDSNVLTSSQINIVIDGNAFKIMPGFETLLSNRPNINIKTLIKGDALDITIACASIIAKENRDRMLDELVISEPDLAKYNWISNRAYGTAEHIRLIQQHGISNYHRRSFLKKIL